MSIIIPAYNEGLRLPESLPRLLASVGRIEMAEVIVVDDGSTDGTACVAEDLLGGDPHHRVIRLPWNCGKGTAVRAGVSAARGQAIVFMDADGASDLNDLPLLLAALEHAEVALGSRRIGAGVTRTSGRKAGSWAFNQLTRSLVALDVADTQCGFKAFRHAEAKILFSLTRSTGFGFDVEVLSIARSMGYRIAEVPVRWSETPGGTFRMSRHTPAMLVDVVRARRYRNRAGLPPVPDGRQRLGELSVLDASELLGRPVTPRPVEPGGQLLPSQPSVALPDRSAAPAERPPAAAPAVLPPGPPAAAPAAPAVALPAAPTALPAAPTAAALGVRSPTPTPTPTAAVPRPTRPSGPPKPTGPAMATGPVLPAAGGAAAGGLARASGWLIPPGTLEEIPGPYSS
ncbi:glycosyltransferase family 2 protein [Frankia sp. Cpl3]|uniref:dolichyl-phosphate beta-glucosyltransferase n=1 Tax=Parafrankia colletiae TaxID=573497 RepID=UPI000A06CB42|nr:dolichyl-phosphate beta-glucosyltransferase [Parafrankia colletiae]MCK9904134.1 glycosyltransferase family 2 protein [Frankia sp. Cpl3]